MEKPAITEEKLNKLMACLVSDFEAKYHAQIDKLSTHIFYLTDRMGCAKAASLNYEYRAIDRHGNAPVNVMTSAYVSAVTTLVDLGYLEFSNESRLLFTITKQGYSKTKAIEAHQNRSNLKVFLDFCKENPDAIKLAVKALAVIGAVITFVTKCT